MGRGRLGHVLGELDERGGPSGAVGDAVSGEAAAGFQSLVCS